MVGYGQGGGLRPPPLEIPAISTQRTGSPVVCVRCLRVGSVGSDLTGSQLPPALLAGSQQGSRRLPPAASAPAVPAGTVKVPVGACCSSPRSSSTFASPAPGRGARRGARCAGGGTTSFTGALPRVAASPFARAAGRAVRVPRSSVRAAAARPKRDAVRAAGCTQSRRRGATGATRLGSAGWDPHSSDLVSPKLLDQWGVATNWTLFPDFVGPAFDSAFLGRLCAA